jgi:hypothetical protein
MLLPSTYGSADNFSQFVKGTGASLQEPFPFRFESERRL